MCLDADLIKGKMKEIVGEKVDNLHLEETLLTFINEKKHFSFGILAFQHYVAFSGTDFSEILVLAAGIELLILAFDIFDDIEDEDNLSKVWMQTDHAISLNAATSLYSISLQVICELESNIVFSQLALKYALNAMQGQHNDLRNFPETEEECLHMIKQKSGSLTAMSAVLGTMLASGEFNPVIENYSYKIGIIKQIENDYYGLFDKTRSDIRKKKRTLINLFLHRQFNSASNKILNMMKSKSGYYSLISDRTYFEELLYKAGVSQYVLMLIKVYENEINNEIEKLEIKIKLW
ncbi:polyprenyl synthetase family protein [Bacillus nakamurai]|uniref:Isoprenyl transferase n=1 Tax=Bacillus nakamurai TaxID=1793963 RepID=A0A150F599_9BACI|nr:polyprenyl synthetase family protein [Bacillus nakamurai]KXZ17532.1 isoprenyl transferase [Bacillus nakamurai]MCC9023742.1 polyprenyl synthetase family protein [Bacillus nakamurai]MED1227144.1 polyprenyl synthetase family protein [Bacillus nakamurai]